jgi:RNA recognition motif-containing protein
MQSVVIMKDEKNISKGFGFVNFKTPDLATKAVKKH